jgi:hypothetical protein
MTSTLLRMMTVKFTVDLVKFTVQLTDFMVKFRALAATAAVNRNLLVHLVMLLGLLQVTAAA